LIIYVKNTSDERIPREGAKPPCFDGQFTFEFEPGETKALSEQVGKHLATGWYKQGLRIVGKAGDAEEQKPGFSIGSDAGLEGFGGGDAKPGKKTGKK